MNPDEPTHFTALVLGTGLVESILAAALAKAGYSVLQLDQSAYYGDTWASLSLQELADHALSSTSAAPAAELLSRSSRFNLSLQPALLRARGAAIDLLVRSRVATYLSFGLLRGIALWREGHGEGGAFELVPGTKADVFNHKALGLVEKRRLTKFLLSVAGSDPLEDDELLQEGSLSFVEFIKKAFAISHATADSLAYALALSSSQEGKSQPLDPALPALQRLRSIIHSTGRYGPSPFLVGHYGGAGDLIGGFSRICAVWGGGQILGRPILALDRAPTPGKPVVAAPLPFSGQTSAPPPPPAAQPPTQSEESVKPLGVPIQLDPEGEPTTFTADWVVSAASHLPTLFPSSTPAADASTAPHTARGLFILDKRVPFPAKAGTAESKEPEEGASAADEDDDERNAPDSSLYVFPPQALGTEGEKAVLGTATAFQVGSGTFACPEAYTVLYLSAPILSPPPPAATAETLLAPHTSILLAQAGISSPLYSTFHFLREAPSPPEDLPPNLMVVPELNESQGTTSGLVTSLDEAVIVAEKLFWTVVGEGAKEEGVQFFAKEAVADDDD